MRIRYQLLCPKCGYPMQWRTMRGMSEETKEIMQSEFFCPRCKFYKVLKANQHILNLKKRVGSWETLVPLYDRDVEDRKTYINPEQ